MRGLGMRGAATAVLLGLLGLVPSMAASQGGPPVAAAPVGNPLVVSHDPGFDEQAVITGGVRIGKLDVDVDVVGGVARTVALVRFDNPTNRALEADFTLTMPAGSVISGYGLDVNGRLVDGVLAPRRLASEAYRKRLQQRVDPGIAQVTAENAFHTKVFPVAPGGSRTVRLEFVSPIDASGAYVLPLETADAVKELRLHVRADAASAVQGPAGVTLAAGKAPGGGAEGLAEASNALLKGALRIEVAAVPGAVTLARHHSGDVFMQVDDAAPAASPGAAGPDRLRLYWDTSLSRRRGAPDAERNLVARYLQAARPRTIDLVLFADGEPRVMTFTDARAALAAVDAIDYRGATSLARVLTLRLPAAGACLMMSDGNVDLDAYRLTAVGCPLFTVSSAADANHGLLAALARRSGGEHLDLRAMSAESMVARMMASATRITAVTDGAGRAVDYALAPAQDGRVRIIAQQPEGGVLKVNYASGAARSYPSGALRPADHDGLGDLWAASRLAELAAGDRPDEGAIMAFARRYAIASPAGDFVVLENPQDYVDIKTAPSDSYGKEGVAAYQAAMAEQRKEDDQRRAERLDQIAGQWSEELDWWETVFQPRPRIAGKAQGGARGGRDFAVAADAPAPPPPPPPPPPPAMRAETSDAGGNTSVAEMVVTAQRREPQVQDAAIPVTVIGADEVAQGEQPAVPTRQIQVEAAEWNPDRPYLKALDAAPGDFDAVFAKQETAYGAAPAFYFDVAEWLFRKGRKADAAAMALNTLEVPGADVTTLNILADRLDRYGEHDRAIWLYERLLYLQPEWPQPRRSLALALVRRADALAGSAAALPQRKADYARAAELLNEIVVRPWSTAYDGIEMVSLMELNRIVPTLKALGIRNPLDKRLTALLDVDLRITLEWNTDHTDMDLWVDEPSGERAIYSNPNTAIGGRLSNDMTEGYGPEEYLLHRAPYGTYRIQANVYAADRLDPNGATVLRAHLYRDWGRPSQREEVFEIELKKDESGARLIGTFKVTRELVQPGKPAAKPPAKPSGHRKPARK